MLIGVPFLYADQVNLLSKKVMLALPNSQYQKSLKSEHGMDSLVVRFPHVYSEKYKIDIIPNFSIILEKVPQNLSSLEYLRFRVVLLTKIPGYSKNPSRDDNLSCGIHKSANMYHEYLDFSNDVEHSMYTVFSANNGVGVCIIFDCTIDTYESQRNVLKSILQSIVIE